jgi:hypothetical protein
VLGIWWLVLALLELDSRYRLDGSNLSGLLLMNANSNLDDFIQSYAHLENSAQADLAPFITRAFQPITFINKGFKTTIVSSNELWKYLDTMHENRFTTNLKLLSNGLTSEEFGLFKSALEIALELSKKLEHPILPVDSLSRAIVQWRAINTLKNKDTSVLELGPGSGYLGLLCGLSNWKYASVEPTQCYSVFNNLLWNFAGFKVSFASHQSDIGSDNFCQIPWWVWANKDSNIRDFNNVAINHVIREMSPLSLTYSLKKISEIKVNYIFVEGWGYHTFPMNYKIFLDHATPLHLNASLGYQQVDIFKIKSFVPESKTFDQNKKLFQKVKNILEKFFIYSIIKNYRQNLLKFKDLKKRKIISGQMIHPKIDFETEQIFQYINSFGVTTKSKNQEIMEYANYYQHF